MPQTKTKLSPQEKIARLRAMYEAFNKRDLDRAHQTYAEDAIWHGVLGEVKGRQAILASGREVMGKVEELKLEPHDILANDEHVVALLKVTIRSKGRTIETNGVEAYHFDDEGNIKEGWAHFEAEKFKGLES